MMRAGQAPVEEAEKGVEVNAAQETETPTDLAAAVASASEDSAESADEESEGESEGEGEAEIEPTASREKVITKRDRMMTRKNQDILSEHYRKLVRDDEDGEEDEDFMTVTRNVDPLADVPQDALVTSVDDARTAEPIEQMDVTAAQSQRKAKLALSKKELVRKGRPGDKKYFTEDGEAREVWLDEAAFAGEGAQGAIKEREKYLEKEREVMAREDVVDRQVAKEKRQEKKRKRKLAEREVSFWCEQRVELALIRLFAGGNGDGRCWCGTGRIFRRRRRRIRQRKRTILRQRIRAVSLAGACGVEEGQSGVAGRGGGRRGAGFAAAYGWQVIVVLCWQSGILIMRLVIHQEPIGSSIG
jgi:hypothetical protein